MTEPFSLGPLPRAGNNFRWTLFAFVMAGLLMAALAVWQLYETTPTRWCALANAKEDNGCGAILLKLLDVKDHALTWTLAILGLTVISVVVVALGVTVKGTGPGGIGVDIGSDKTRVTDGENTVDIPTPPSG